MWKAKWAAALESSHRLFSVVSRVMLKCAPARSSAAMFARRRIMEVALEECGICGCGVCVETRRRGAFLVVSTFVWMKSLFAVFRVYKSLISRRNSDVDFCDRTVLTSFQDTARLFFCIRLPTLLLGFTAYNPLQDSSSASLPRPPWNTTNLPFSGEIVFKFCFQARQTWRSLRSVCASGNRCCLPKGGHYNRSPMQGSSALDQPSPLWHKRCRCGSLCLMCRQS